MDRNEENKMSQDPCKFEAAIRGIIGVYYGGSIFGEAETLEKIYFIAEKTLSEEDIENIKQRAERRTNSKIKRLFYGQKI